MRLKRGSLSYGLETRPFGGFWVTPSEFSSYKAAELAQRCVDCAESRFILRKSSRGQNMVTERHQKQPQMRGIGSNEAASRIETSVVGVEKDDMECLCCHKRGKKERRNNKECNTYVGEEERGDGSPSKTKRVDRMTVHRTKMQIKISLSTTRAGGVSKGRGRGGGSH